MRIDFQGSVTTTNTTLVNVNDVVTGYVQYSTDLPYDGFNSYSGFATPPNAFFATINGSIWGTGAASTIIVAVDNDTATGDMLGFVGADLPLFPDCIAGGKCKITLALEDTLSPYDLLASSALPTVSNLNLTSNTNAVGSIYTFMPFVSGIGEYEITYALNSLEMKSVPEPTTMLLLGLGLIGVAGIRKRLKR